MLYPNPKPAIISSLRSKIDKLNLGVLEKATSFKAKFKLKPNMYNIFSIYNGPERICYYVGLQLGSEMSYIFNSFCKVQDKNTLFPYIFFKGKASGPVFTKKLKMRIRIRIKLINSHNLLKNSLNLLKFAPLI